MDAIISTFQEKAKESAEKEIERLAKILEHFKKALLAEVVNNLYTHSDAFASKMSKKTLAEMCESAKDEDDAEKSEKAEDDDAEVEEDAEEDAADDDDDEALPKGLTKSHKDKLANLYESLEDKKVINVKTGTAISKVSKEYVRKGKFVGPKDMKKVVEWCHENLGSESDEEEKSDDDAEISPGYSQKKLNNLKKAIEKCPKNKWVLVSTNKAMEKSDKNKSTYLWGAKFCVKKEGDGSKLFKAIEKALADE